MIHHKCENKSEPYCRKNRNQCKDHFPYESEPYTVHVPGGYPKYRRRCLYNIVKKNETYTDSNVVAYNAYLLLKYNTHMNVQISNTITNCKYLFKYVTKGPDHATVRLEQSDHNGKLEVNVPNINEIKHFIDMRYVGSSEAFWRIISFNMSTRYPAVERLPVHLENNQNVIYQEGQEQKATIEPPSTKLTKYFESITKNREKGINKKLLYGSYPNNYIWQKNDWVERKNRTDMVGRIYTVSPKKGDLFYMRLLLTKRADIGSYKELKTFNEIEYGTYKDCCDAMGFLQSDSQWKECLLEQSEVMLPYQLRDLFVIILTQNNPTNIIELWNLKINNDITFADKMAEDFQYERTNDSSLHPNEEDISKLIWTLHKDFIKLGYENGYKRFSLPKPKYIGIITIYILKKRCLFLSMPRRITALIYIYIYIYIILNI